MWMLIASVPDLCILFTFNHGGTRKGRFKHIATTICSDFTIYVV